MPEFDVLVIGELNVDLIFNQIKTFPVVGKEVLADQMSLTLGSSSAIFASNLSSIGAGVAFAGMIGSDAFGDLVISSLQRKMVNTRYVIRSDKFNTGATVVMNQDNDRAMLTYAGAMTALSCKDITEAMLLSARHLHISSIFLQTGLHKDLIILLKKAKMLGMTTSLDPQWDPGEKWDLPWEELMKQLDVFLPNMQEFYGLTGSGNFESALKKFGGNNAHLVVKDGTNGAYLYHGGELLHQPAYLNPDVVDCIGAGDSFDAGFISRYIRGRNPAECLQYGSLMGALNTTAVGGTGAFESYEHIRKIAAERFNVMI